MALQGAKEKEIHYTICPVGNASYLAAKRIGCGRGCNP